MTRHHEHTLRVVSGRLLDRVVLFILIAVALPVALVLLIGRLAWWIMEAWWKERMP